MLLSSRYIQHKTQFTCILPHSLLASTPTATDSRATSKPVRLDGAPQSCVSIAIN